MVKVGGIYLRFQSDSQSKGKLYKLGIANKPSTSKRGMVTYKGRYMSNKD